MLHKFRTVFLALHIGFVFICYLQNIVLNYRTQVVRPRQQKAACELKVLY